MFKNYILFYLALISYTSKSQEVSSPDSFLGYDLGTVFSRHHQVVDYYKYLDSNSDWVDLQPYGTTNEGRLLQLAFISNPQNLKNLETIRNNHLKNSGSTNGEINSDKVIVWLSYNVHGNESSSTEASMKTIYNLITKYKDWLKDTIVIIDPCINPDGRDRYVNWYKQKKRYPYNPSSFSREHQEPWQNGRTNHYAFDLNRDWAWATQIETRQRLVKYNQWLPHIHVDFHEQGINSPYYFAPAAEPIHENITDFQRYFQDIIGKNHAKYFDKNAWLYNTKEKFDLLYPSYGDTYPSFLGAIGMTYEQAGGGRAGLGLNNNEGIEVTLVERINHHYTTSISTVEIASKSIKELNTAYQKFYKNKSTKYKNFILSGNVDNINKLKTLLDRHKIKYGVPNEKKDVKGYDFNSKKTKTIKLKYDNLIITTDQIKGKMVHVLFEPQTFLSDSLTYDITAWSLPYAYGLKALATKENIKLIKVESENYVQPKNNGIIYGWASKWNSLDDAKFLAELLNSKIKVRFNNAPLTNQSINWKRGSLFILKGDNLNFSGSDLKNKIFKIAKDNNRKITQLSSGYSSSGPDLGSDKLSLISPPRISVLTEGNSSTYNAGELIYFFEQELGYQANYVNQLRLNNEVLSKTDVLILPSGYYNFNTIKADLISWIRNGGTLIALGRALDALSDTDPFEITKKESTKDKTSDTSPNSFNKRKYISNLITGSIYKAKVDKTHPMAYGYENFYYTLKLSGDAYKLLKNQNIAYLKSAIKPHSGFAGSNVALNQGNSLLFGNQNLGHGNIVYMVDNPLFRAFWENGKLFMANAIFFTGNRDYNNQ
ncbi:MAG: M14 family zinc carboxypeptidase [Flavobacteriaceae bacterium]|nr:M14 family zinc carboxypeptidase [Flavobacteriaceae bacterium]